MTKTDPGLRGSFKNPSSRRGVDFTDPIEAVEIVLLADLLLRVLAKIEDDQPAARPSPGCMTAARNLGHFHDAGRTGCPAVVTCDRPFHPRRAMLRIVGCALLITDRMPSSAWGYPSILGEEGAAMPLWDLFLTMLWFFLFIIWAKTMTVDRGHRGYAEAVTGSSVADEVGKLAGPRNRGALSTRTLESTHPRWQRTACMTTEHPWSER